MPLKKLSKDEKSKKKFEIWKRLWKNIDKYNSILIIKSENIGSSQFSDIRCGLREYDADLIMGKGSLLRRGIIMKMRKPVEKDVDYEFNFKTYKERLELEKIKNVLEKHAGLIFCKSEDI